MTKREAKAVDLYHEYLADIDRLSQRHTVEDILDHPVCEYALKAMEWQAEQCAERYQNCFSQPITQHEYDSILNAGTEDCTLP